jgi:hypothetical protein
LHCGQHIQSLARQPPPQLFGCGAFRTIDNFILR